MKKLYIIIVVLMAFGVLVWFGQRKKNIAKVYQVEQALWEVQSVDTVKYSRDVAKEKENDLAFNETIERQVELISETGATHVSIGTPYDEEFVPFLDRWVKAARKYGLKVWFRGNFSGWEKWFGYDRITREQHLQMTSEFITSHGELFEDGDIFTACTECENGGPGDPRLNGDVVGHRKFLIDGHKTADEAFRKIGKGVRTNYFPMNGDVAELVMDKATTKALGGVVVVDHYVSDTNRLLEDIIDLAEKSGGRVMLGEFGAPIPDIHGEFNDDEQAGWVEDAMAGLSSLDVVLGVNYWTSFGSSTQLWNGDGSARKVVQVLKKYYSPNVFTGYIVDETGRPIAGAKITVNDKIFLSDGKGKFSLITIGNVGEMSIYASGYESATVEPSEKIVMKKVLPGLWYDLGKVFHGLFD